MIICSELKFSWVLDAHTFNLHDVRQGVNSAHLLILLSAPLAPAVEGLFPNV